MPEPGATSHEIGSSLSRFGIDEEQTDEAVIKQIEKSGKDVIEYYKNLRTLKEKGAKGEPLFVKSRLPKERQLEILGAVLHDLPSALEYQRDTEKKTENSLGTIELDKAQWATVATSPPIDLEFDSKEEADLKKKQLEDQGVDCELISNNDKPSLRINGCRVSFAFHKKMCEFKEEDSRGCRFCMLSAKNRDVQRVTPRQQLQALEDALNKTAGWGTKRTVFEILPDGSFLNTKEVPPRTQIGMMERLSKEASIFRVAVETRPEFCTVESVRNLLEHLRPDQQLNIYFGLEDTDDFVTAIIHNKGYGFEHFKQRIQTLADGLTPDEKKRLKLSAYSIIKPAYLTERESIDSGIRTMQDVDAFSHQVGIPIDVKYEPAVVSAGTIQGYLYKQQNTETKERQYKPLSYFAVAEMVARLAELNLEKHAKFGQRDDIDNFSVVAMVPQLDDENSFSQFDFMVYNAVQRFNTTKDVRIFLVDMKIPVEESEEFKKWEKEHYGASNTSALYRLVKNSFEQKALTDTEIQKIELQKKVWRICDKIEYNKDFSNLLRSDRIKGQNVVKQKIGELFSEENIKASEIKNFVFIDIGDATTEKLTTDNTDSSYVDDGASVKAGYQIEVIIENDEGLPQSIWVKIPLIASEIFIKPPYIYD